MQEEIKTDCINNLFCYYKCQILKFKNKKNNKKKNKKKTKQKVSKRRHDLI